MPAPLDARLRDDEALTEIELTSDLIIACRGIDEHLTEDQVDEILGIKAS